MIDLLFEQERDGFEFMPVASPPKAEISDDIKMLVRLQKKIRRLYAVTKNNRTVYGNLVSFLQPLLEVRYTWEHVSDALLDENEEWNTDPVEMAKARAHLLRCYTDLTEILFYQIRMYAKKITRGMRKEDIESVIPGYYSSFFSFYKKAQSAMVNLKDRPEQNFDTRVGFLDEINEICEELLDKLDVVALKELKRKSVAHQMFNAIKYLGTAIAGGLITLLLQYIFQTTP